MTLPCWGILDILPRNVDFIWNLIFAWICSEYRGWWLRRYFLGAISFLWGRNWDWGYVCIGCWLFVKVMGVVPSMHLCHSLALAVTLPLMMTNDKVDFRHNQPSHHRSISFICGTEDVWVVNKITDDVIDRYGNRDLSADDDKWQSAVTARCRYSGEGRIMH